MSSGGRRHNAAVPKCLSRLLYSPTKNSPTSLSHLLRVWCILCKMIPSNRPQNLRIDTNCSRHNGQPPKQVFPPVSKTRNLFRRAISSQKTPSKQHLKISKPIFGRSLSENATQPQVGKPLAVTMTSQPPLLHKRVQRLRPPPLNLATNVYPSDQAIPTPFSMPPVQTLNARPVTVTHLQTVRHSLRAEGSTPTFLITPAEDEFNRARSQENLLRPSSSVYSQPTAGLQGASRVPSTTTDFEEGAPRPARTSTVKTTQSAQSRGWWSVLTSPFTAKTAPFSEATTAHEEELCTAVPIDEKSRSLDETDTKINPFTSPAYVFSSPTEDELKPSKTPRPAMIRHDTAAALNSYFSPFTATPPVEEAHVAAVSGPQSTIGEQKKIDLSSHDRGQRMDSATMFWSNHSAGSVGLGITDSDEKRLFTPPTSQVDQRRGPTIRRFGRLTSIESQSTKPQRPWHRRFAWLIIAVVTIPVLLLIIILAVCLSNGRGQKTSIPAAWTNTSGFPPLFTGIATVIQPPLVKAVSGCVNPQSLWSCFPAVNEQLNFRLEIRFHNGSVPKNETLPVKRDGHVSQAEQQFLGQYTDNVTEPYVGEETPFTLSFLSDTAKSVYPPVKNQKLRLFNRGQDGEHFGFYNYFDRKISAANVSCTWTETRLHLQIWTRGSTQPKADSGADDMGSPGSFPYPITVTLDRHGGRAKHKELRCSTNNGKAESMTENRSFGGSLVNAAAVAQGELPGRGNEEPRRYGGIDGGSGGCMCQWATATHN
ncbi:hypothetical protein K470DRAFT_260404 [Piedraia hortae CBS 480.64]|uniref:Glycoprotease family protein n=1 Tax=Piedraia hortae CBS 480.64 TaxID=1314780 RepID=A0A6A7BRJ9_9PEZI|nr:hypothetical protein K470DRAFT_260404 [Piedraia hortae CBS 480.64]